MIRRGARLARFRKKWKHWRRQFLYTKRDKVLRGSGKSSQQIHTSARSDLLAQLARGLVVEVRARVVEKIVHLSQSRQKWRPHSSYANLGDEAVAYVSSAFHIVF